MSKRIVLKHKCGKVALEELMKLYAVYLEHGEPETEHDLLLLNHMSDLYAQLDQLKRGEAQNVTIKLTSTEALAFFQQWQHVDLKKWPYAQTIVNAMLHNIDHKAKSNTSVKPIDKERWLTTTR